MKLKIQVLLSLACLCTFLVASAHASEWIDPLGGNFVDSDNWSFFIVPDENEGADYLLPNNYTVTFPLSAFSSTVNVQNGNVIFDLPSMPAQGIYEIDLLLVGLGGVPIMNPPAASLKINGGRVQVESAVEIYKGATLGGNGDIFSFGPSIYPGGRLTGTLNVIGSTTFNQGVVAPGDSIGTLTLNSDYFHAPQGILEIEVGGTGPTQHDLLDVSGTVQLQGNLTVPFVNGYMPTNGHSILIMDSEMPIGKFRSVTIPGLNGSLAAEISYVSSGVSLSFINAVPAPFNSSALNPPPPPPSTPNYWGNGAYWPVNVPTSKNVVALVNQETGPRVIGLNAGVVDSENAFVHEISIAGNTHPMTLVVPTNTNFTAVKSMDVDNRGILELNGGTVHSNQVNVNAGGLLRGTGTIDGDVVLGSIAGSPPATLSPGFSVGEITFKDNLTIVSNGTVEIEVFTENDFDTVIVDQNANLGGTLEVVIPLNVDPADLVGVPLAFMSAGNVMSEFDDVELVNYEAGYFIDVDYSGIAVAMSVGLDGDMNFNGYPDPQDISLFATGLTDEMAYIQAVLEYPIGPGDMNGDGFFDFDDIEQFSQIDFPGLTADDVVAYLLDYMTPAVPEPSAAILIVAGCVLLTGTAGRGLRYRSSIQG